MICLHVDCDIVDTDVLDTRIDYTKYGDEFIIKTIKDIRYCNDFGLMFDYIYEIEEHD